MKILLVDDEKIAIEGIMANVNFADYGIGEVDSANSFQQAQEIILQGDVDIVICDIEMPNGSGLELIEWINQYDSRIVTMILSCHTEFTFAQAAVGLACKAYITKPATPEVLHKAVSEAVGLVEKRNTEMKIQKMGEEYIHQMAGNQGDEVDIVEKVHKYIMSHLGEELSVEELSQMFYLSQNHLTRIFKKKYKTTIVEFMMESRLDLAEELLKNTNLTVTAISAKVGYPNYAYFTKIFKKRCGYTPSAYRNKWIN